MDHVARRLEEKLVTENYNLDAFEASIATDLLGDLIRNLPYIADNKRTLDIAHRNLLTFVGIDVDDPATWPQNIAFCDQIFDHICTAASELHSLIAPAGFYKDVYGIDHANLIRLREADHALLAKGEPHTGTPVLCCSAHRQGVVVGRNTQTVTVRHCGFLEDKYDLLERNYCLQAIKPLVGDYKRIEESSDVVFFDWKKYKRRGTVVETLGPLIKVSYFLKNGKDRACWIEPTRLVETESSETIPAIAVNLDS